MWDTPNALWSELGRRLKMQGGETAPLLDLDQLLETPRLTDLAELADYDLETGRLNPPKLGDRVLSSHPQGSDHSGCR